MSEETGSKEPVVRKIAIVGSAPSTRAQAPYDDPSWEMWGLAHRYPAYADDGPKERFSRLYEVHDTTVYKRDNQEGYEKFLNAPPCPIWTRPRYLKNLPNCEALPMDAMRKYMLLSYDYFASSLSFMLCHALVEGVTDVGIWGVDLTADTPEYSYQKPNLEFLIALGMRDGVRFHIPTQSALLKMPHVYGEGESAVPPYQTYLENMINTAEEDVGKLKEKTILHQGAALGFKKAHQVFLGDLRGSDVSDWQ